MTAKKNSVLSQNPKTAPLERKNSGERKQERRQSLEPNGDVRLRATKKSASSHSLPDLIAEDLSTATKSDFKPDILIPAPEQDSDKRSKKRSFFGNKFKKIIKT